MNRIKTQAVLNAIDREARRGDFAKIADLIRALRHVRDSARQPRIL